MKIPIIDSFGLSDIGTIRPNNEDVIALLPSHNFFAIADGMGGHKAGEIAAKEATNELIAAIMEFFNPRVNTFFSQQQITLNIIKAIEKANKRVFTLGQENISFKGMGTTLCCLHLYHNWITYAHVGDSRIYLFRKNTLTQLTKDHSLISEMNQDHFSINKSLHHPYKNIITKAIGTNVNITPSINIEKYYPQDRFLMCTDGLSDYLSNEEISNIIQSSESNKTAVKKLIESAKNNGSRDNISGLLIEIKTFNE